MCNSTPKAPPLPPKAPETPVLADSSTSANADRDRRRRASASGGSSRSTILTSPSGVQSSGSTAVKTLLGQ